MSLSDAQLDRYARHLILKEVGGAGQAALLGAHVALVGAGGIGAPAITTNSSSTRAKPCRA